MFQDLILQCISIGKNGSIVGITAIIEKQKSMKIALLSGAEELKNSQCEWNCECNDDNEREAEGVES